ncbi:S1 RNA-binding domain-containing protein [Streptomyces sp. NP-1717]|uniref:S1 RNA-binding domain-containing protein n=1 Tax=Streptomyces sp. NP-1717 TaxID=2704470 RepID=UPI001F5C4B10|nr:S1 RNA-binding domain-containing protein [Streptomyces sp. NP-1717]MCI3221300.1 S1 RNA-binding domain-containing protein [Streptomyces sp. NP-1717]
MPDGSDAVRTGDEVTVVVTAIDRERRRLLLSRRQGSPQLPLVAGKAPPPAQ